MKYHTNSISETHKIAAKIAKDFQNKGGVIALTGKLGAGKTTFAASFAKALGIKEKIISPTFVLVREHKIPNSKRILFHIDLYRLENSIEPNTLGIEDMLSNPENIVLIEWAEKLNQKINYQNKVEIKLSSNSQREININ
ncbi:tRNA (adenosine(37)-N6)-threonylcarbamoyltransferase complex ATPase subunit type 1 TsaE [Candidatus Daviesbacteria bacterium]|nr:tRNA (adenosine(37)-N6)-threonylcarbamoyltransferase complex ATPase subunit type 1 TsaE [Candidatus Daviesbacteria bacterium]